MERNKYPLEEYALEIFSSDSYFSLNKKLLLKYGPVKAVYICNLIDQYRILKDKGETEDTLFKISHEQQEQQTGITPYTLKECKKFFIEEDVLSISHKGLPARDRKSTL